MSDEKLIEIDYVGLAFDDSVSPEQYYEITHDGTGHEPDGTPHSGRFPWGSGDKAFQHPKDFYTFIRKLERQGVPETVIAENLGYSTTKLRAYKTVATYETKKLEMQRARELEAVKIDDLGKKYTREQIGKMIQEELGLDEELKESTIRNYIKPEYKLKAEQSLSTAKMLMKMCDEKGNLDVGAGVPGQLNVSSTMFKAALEICYGSGYEIHKGSVNQLTNPSQKTNLILLCQPGTPSKAAYDYSEIHQVIDTVATDDGGSSYRGFQWPTSIDGKRVMIRYKEEGGEAKDGLIEIRRGNKDLSLGKRNYVQARILVDDEYYLKGMAVYSDGKDMPDGVDIIFNSKKELGTPFHKCLKSTADNLKKDPTNPFGSTISPKGQTFYEDPNGKYTINGKRMSLNAVNMRAEEGDWSEWSKAVPSQMLSKQPKETIHRQLSDTMAEVRAEYDEILKVTNPTIKAHLLEDFADNVDAKSVDLKAVSFPGASYNVLLPAWSLKDNEVYAPGFPEGTQVALVRFPHESTSQIPILTVTHRNKECEEMLMSGERTPLDVVVINKTVADRMSGADFDGDAVYTIPTNTKGTKIQNSKQFKGLIGFDTEMYAADDSFEDENGITHYYRNGKEFKHITEDYKQKMMGIASNLITDMTLQGAPEEDVTRAIKYSMTVIDSYKHHLDYKACAKEQGIKELQKKYQPHLNNAKYGGAATLISKAKSPISINKRAEGRYVLNEPGNPDNGNELEIYDFEERLYKDIKTGKIYPIKNRKVEMINEKTGEKYYHDTKEAYTKVITDKVGEDGKPVLVPGYIKVGDKYKRPRIDVRGTKDIYYLNDDKEFVKVEDYSKLDVNVLKEDIEKLALSKDAREYSSGTIQEAYYAEFSNSLKALANEARKSYIVAMNERIPYSPEAAKQYEQEVLSIRHKIQDSAKNQPIERYANIMAAAEVKQKLEDATEEYSKDDLKKLRNNALTQARMKYGAHSVKFEITENEWAAIQAGAISQSMLEDIIRYANKDILRKLATPREGTVLTDSMINRIKMYSVKGETAANIAQRLGISVSTVKKYIKES